MQYPGQDLYRIQNFHRYMFMFIHRCSRLQLVAVCTYTCIWSYGVLTVVVAAVRGSAIRVSGICSEVCNTHHASTSRTIRIKHHLQAIYNNITSNIVILSPSHGTPQSKSVVARCILVHRILWLVYWLFVPQAMSLGTKTRIPPSLDFLSFYLLAFKWNTVTLCLETSVS